MNRIENLKRCAQRFLKEESCGHDYFHCLRVVKIAEEIARTDFPDVNVEVVTAAALMHDICRPWEKETGFSHYSEEALQIIGEQLHESGYSATEGSVIVDIIRWHDIYNPSLIPHNSFTDELRIHQDADRIDALGAIGIARTFAFGGSHNLPLFIPGENLSFKEYFIDLPEHKTSSIAHFYEKLLKLRDEMNTPTGKRLAKIRHSRMERFLEEFFEEWG
jgi:uncharacterized protein